MHQKAMAAGWLELKGHHWLYDANSAGPLAGKDCGTALPSDRARSDHYSRHPIGTNHASLLPRTFAARPVDIRNIDTHALVLQRSRENLTRNVPCCLKMRNNAALSSRSSADKNCRGLWIKPLRIN